MSDNKEFTKQDTNEGLSPPSSLQDKNKATEAANGEENGVSAQKKKGKSAVFQYLGIIFIILGFLGLALPFFNNFLIAHFGHMNLHSITAEDMERNMKDAKYFPLEDIQEIGFFNFWSQLGKAKDDEVVGELVMPSLHIDLPIFSNSSNENLLAGVGMLYPDRHPGVGNYAISGHRAQGKNVLLHNLMDADIGDTIYITNKKYIYVYRVVNTVQKDTDAVHMLEDSQTENYSNKPIVSIMTCYNGKADSRWFVVGSFVTVLPYNEAVLKTEYTGN